MKKINYYGTMYFSYGKGKRDDIKSLTTFEAIKNGERTSSTWNRNWCEKANKGDIIRFFNSNKIGVGDFVNVQLIEKPTKINLSSMTELELEQWSKNEGWSMGAIKEKWINYFNKPTWNIRFELYKEKE